MTQPVRSNPTTSYTLLDRLGHDATQRNAMGQFVSRYTLFIVRLIKRTAPNLQDCDISDIAQSIYVEIFDGLIQRRFSSERKNFRKWFAVVIKNKVFQHLRQRNAKYLGTGDDGLSDIASPDNSYESQTLRELELYELQRVQKLVSSEVSEIVWQAFQLSVYGETDSHGQRKKLAANEIGQRLKLAPERVYAYKFKVLQRMRELMVDTI